jgi:ABC-type transport system involved in cytochrome bd biosynthesis fused ATPase/permease subunit
MSGGERQRLAIARALLQAAPIWLLDEPTTHLDERYRQEISQTLWEAAGERSMIWVTHDLSELARMDEVLVLKDGRVLERGTPPELVQAGGWYSRWQKDQRF